MKKYDLEIFRGKLQELLGIFLRIWEDLERHIIYRIMVIKLLDLCKKLKNRQSLR